MADAMYLMRALLINANQCCDLGPASLPGSGNPASAAGSAGTTRADTVTVQKPQQIHAIIPLCFIPSIRQACAAASRAASCELSGDVDLGVPFLRNMVLIADCPL
jgi:hypothetical protein